MNATLLQNEGLDTIDPVNDKITQAVKSARARLNADVPNHDTEKKPKAKGERAGRKTGTRTEKSQEEIRQLNSELDKLFNADNFRGLVRAPADLLMALTGDKIWDLPAEEVETLSTTGATCARYFLSTDPKWLSLTLFSMAILTTYGTRIALYKARHSGDVKKGQT